MDSHKAYFKDKKITLMGLGLLGRGLGDAKFLAECGADLLVTDIKGKEELKDSFLPLKRFSNIKFVLGKHRLQDFRRRDLIIKSAGIPLDSAYLKEADKTGVSVKMSTALFVKLSKTKTIGVTGTKGKSSTTHLIENILKTAGKKFFLGGNVRGLATLPLLKEAKEGDLVLMELDSWQLQGFGYDKISPNISVFTNLMNDHMNYYKNDVRQYLDDKANIFKYQSEEDFLITSPEVKKIIDERFQGKIKSRIILTGVRDVPDDWNPIIFGEHNKESIAFAIKVGEILGIDKEIVKKGVEQFEGVPARLELVGEAGGVKYYNDTTATITDAAIAALKAIQANTEKSPKIVLLAGGSDKNLEFEKFVEEMAGRVKKLILFEGHATDKIVSLLAPGRFDFVVVSNMPQAFEEAQKAAKKGDIVLLSPGATSFGIFKNEFDRGDQFVDLVNSLK